MPMHHRALVRILLQNKLRTQTPRKHEISTGATPGIDIHESYETMVGFWADLFSHTFYQRLTASTYYIWRQSLEPYGFAVVFARFVIDMMRLTKSREIDSYLGLD